MPHSIDPLYLCRLATTIDDVNLLAALAERRGREALNRDQRAATLEDLRRGAVVASIESSNRLEGIEAPGDRTRRIAELRVEPRTLSEQEIAGYRDALELIHSSAASMPLTTGVVRQLHELVFRYVPQQGGRWKSVDNSIVELDASRSVVRTRFRAVSAVETPQAMQLLAERHDAAVAAGVDALVLTPLAILDFLCVHPFIDGNGRVARLLTLQLLYRSGLEIGRYVSLERLIEETKETYYESLERSSVGWHEQEHDALPWLRYFWGVLLRAYQLFEERVGAFERVKGSKSDHVRRAALRRSAPFRISELEVDCPGISRETIRLVLRQLRREGSLDLTGHGAGARWSVVSSGKE